MDQISAILATSMQNDIFHVNAISQNIANVSTTGFKKIYSQVDSGGSNITSFNSTQGTLIRTGSDYDIAIEGEGFLVVKDGINELLTRGGTLHQDHRGALIALPSGFPVLDEGGQEIFLDLGAFVVNNDGRVIQNDREIAQLKRVNVEHLSHLESLGKGVYQYESFNSLLLENNNNIRLAQGFLENSNVNSTQEFVALMQTVRHFESVQKSMHAIDAMWDKTLRTLGEF